MAHRSDPAELALHGVRVLGSPTTARTAARFDIGRDTVEDALLDPAARGWVRTLTSGGTTGWSLIDAGRTEGERRLAAEPDRAGARPVVTLAHARLLPLNRRFGAACTDWQVAAHPPGPDGPGRPHGLAVGRTRAADADVRRGLVPRSVRRAGRPPRAVRRLRTDRLSSALRRVAAGQRAWVDAPDRDSCHLVWIQFHEDLLATLGIPRGSDG